MPSHERTTPPRVGLQDQPTSWTDDLPVCYLSGVGFSTNQIYREDGFRREEHEFEDRSFHFRVDDVYLYGLFDGHDGARASNFAAQRMPAELLLGQLNGKSTDEGIKEVLQQAFNAVEKGFFESIEDFLVQRIHVHQQLPEGISGYDAARQFPDLVDQLQRLDMEIAGGTTATIALIRDSKLSVANVGNSRALVCKRSPEGMLRVTQLTNDHTLANEDEIQRLTQLGLDPEKLCHSRKLGNHEVYTRCIGDYSVKGGYKDIEILSPAVSEPVITEPEVCSIQLDESCSFLILMTDGVYNTLVDATGTQHVNADIASMVASEFSVQSTLNGVAQAVIDRIVRIHHDSFMTASNDVKQLCQKRDDMTLLVRNFNHPLPNALSSPTSGGLHLPLSGPYNQARNNESPSVFPSNNNNIEATPGGLQTKPIFVAKALFQVGAPLGALNKTLSGTNTNTVMSGTFQSTRSSAYTSTYTSSNDSTQSGDQGLFNSYRNRSIHHTIELDEDGRIEPYVDFSDFYAAMAKLTDSQRETLDADVKPQPTYETINEEAEAEKVAEKDDSKDDGNVSQ
ncbi:TGF-beta-activated kinase 1 and MAP3K7-binding protein 1 [Lingula anatina]|uniref:TGF-beta-activated kinase 1 and MAP3K7-binding protein 1 n=1 Tax=Lingula anatina TaxID=7574 RepID=A0A1S3HJ30_LINAN|nr:TGF-beta-activated kinase 1 and MAP3K7-binding protein 1 [Lingula anatina]|eukprot:XP_013386022.1 TGF-beta-activated kinase 1 and MAP3K7-binding protein 1 [Lingula anatina]